MTHPATTPYRNTLLSALAVLAALVAIVVAVLASANSSGSSATTHPRGPALDPGAAALSGRTWFVITVKTDGHTAAVTPGTPEARARVTFDRRGSFLANDGVNSLFGHYRVTPSGYRTVGDTGSTAIGYVGADPTLLAVQRAMTGALAGRTAVGAEIHADRLTLRFATTTITLRSGPRVTDTLQPSSSARVPASGTASK